MAEDGHAHVVLGIFLLDAVGIVHGAALRTLGHDDDAGAFTLADAPADEFLELVGVAAVLGNNRSLCPTGDGTVLSQESGIAPHHLDEEDALVRSGRVADLVDTLHDGVERGVVANRGIGAVKVIVNRTGQSDARHVELVGKDACSGQRTVTADDHQGINALSHHIVVGQLAALFGHEFLAAGRFQHRTATLDDVAHILGGKLLDFVLDQTFIAPVNTFHPIARSDCGTRHGTDSRVHSRRVTARC